MQYLDLPAKKALAEQVLRVQPNKMTPSEMDLAMALLLRRDVQLAGGRIGETPLVQKEGQWAPFTPMSNWADMGEVLANVALVTGSHQLYENDDDPEEVTGHWYSCHGYFSGVKTDGFELPAVIGETAAKLLQHHVLYSWVR